MINRRKLADFYLGDLKGIHSIIYITCDYRPQYQVQDIIYVFDRNLGLNNIKTEIIKNVLDTKTRSNQLELRTIAEL